MTALDTRLLDRLDPALHPFTAARIDLSVDGLAGVRVSLNDRRRDAVALVDATGVQISQATVPREDGPPVAIRLYRAAPAPSPVVIYLHSGAFVLGNLDTDHRQCVELARRGGCTVVSVDYRLAPEHPYPAALDDAAAVLRWVWTTASEAGFDHTRLALAGNSAGGALAAGLAQRAAAGTLPPVVGVLLHQPVLDDRPTATKAEFVIAPGFDGAAAAQMWRHYLGDSTPGPTFVPARYSRLTGLPSTFITCSELDPLRDEAVDYAGRLLRAGVRTDLHLFSGTCHGFDSLCPDWEVSRAVLDLHGAALRGFLGKA
ncbi:alpha/beta hydrolase [Mycolicibacterium sp. CBM1]